MSIVKCSGCDRLFEGDRFGESVGFLLHECGGMNQDPPIEDGESFEDWQARCEAK